MFCRNCGKELVENALFCSRCGTKIEIATENNLYSAMEPELMESLEKNIVAKVETFSEEKDINEEVIVTVEVGHEKDVTDKNDIYRELIGKNADYYLAAFEKIGRGEKTKFMWSSLFASLGLPLYRNCDEVAKKYYLIPYVLLLSSLILMPCATLFGFSTLSMVLLGGSYLVSMVGSIWLFVNAIRLGKKFPHLYLMQLDKTIEIYDIKTVADCDRVPEKQRKTNAKKVVMICCVIFVIIAVLSLIGGLITSAGISNSWAEEKNTQPVNNTNSFLTETSEGSYDWVEFGESLGCDVGYVNISSGALNVRSYPSTDASVIGKLKDGTTVYVIDQHDGWSKVDTDIGIQGYVASDYITYDNYAMDFDNDAYTSLALALFDDSYLNIIDNSLWEFKPDGIAVGSGSLYVDGVYIGGFVLIDAYDYSTGEGELDIMNDNGEWEEIPVYLYFHSTFADMCNMEGTHLHIDIEGMDETMLFEII